MTGKRRKVVIVGGGTAGISVAARLLKSLHNDDVIVIEPADKHYYQPLWTLVGAGVFDAAQSERDECRVIPTGSQWIKERVTELRPDENQVVTDRGRKVDYEVLILCPGIQVNWNAIKGLPETIGKNCVASNYSIDYVSYTWECIRSFKGGVALFTDPTTVVKCGGAPQKICYLAEDYFRKSCVRDKSKLIYASGKPKLFAVERYAKTLEKVVARKNIETRFKQNLVEIDGAAKEATFENVDTKERSKIKYDMIHVTPPMGPPDFIKNSLLADANGWVDVDKNTLQHVRYANVFGLGDCANLPTSKTGAAIRKQAPVVVANVLAWLRQLSPVAEYNGYTSCPVVTSYKGLVLAEFDYALNPQETFPIDQSKEHYSMYLLKKWVLPRFYWDGMLKGRL